MDQKVSATYTSLSEDARGNPNVFCDQRAAILARAMIETGIPRSELQEVSIMPVGSGYLVPTYIDDVNWTEHVVIGHYGMIYDPLFGEPVEQTEYFNTAFKDKTENNLDVKFNQITDLLNLLN